jgi:carbonic anhydrase/acetyltransferase-like protein (isoleucine patch superfamily)
VEIDGVKYHHHPNGGGMVAETTQVADSVFVGPFAKICGHCKLSGKVFVFGNAWIFDKAEASGSVEVFEHAEVGGNAKVQGDIKIGGETKILGNVSDNRKMPLLPRSDMRNESWGPLKMAKEGA